MITPVPPSHAFPSPPIPTLYPLHFTIIPPQCYPFVTELLACLGTVTNTQAIPIRRVALTVQAFAADGTPLAEATAHLEQRVLPPGGTAPYRVLLRVAEAHVRTLVVTPLSADPDPGHTVVTLDTQILAIETGSRTRVRLSLRNPTPDTLARGRVVLMLLGREGALAGYRVVTLDTLPPGDQPSLTVELLPHAVPLPYIVRVYAEADP